MDLAVRILLHLDSQTSFRPKDTGWKSGYGLEVSVGIPIVADNLDAKLITDSEDIWIQRVSGHYEKFDDLLSVVKEFVAPESASELLQRAAQARNQNRPRDALRDYARALELSRASKNRQQICEALNGLGQVERDLGDYIAAQTRYEELAGLYRSESESVQRAHALRHLADVLRHQSKFEEAETLYRKVLEVYAQSSEVAPLHLANALRPLAIVLGQMNRPDESKRLWKQARQIYLDQGISAGVKECDEQLKSNSP